MLREYFSQVILSRSEYSATEASCFLGDQPHMPEIALAFVDTNHFARTLFKGES